MITKKVQFNGVQFHLNLPKEIVKKFKISKGETALIEVVSDDTIKITFSKDVI